MALTFVQLADELSVCLGTGASSTDDIRTSFKRWLNQAFRLIAYSYPWDDMRGEQRISTVAPYSTGTATFTQGSTTVTGSGTTWTAAMEKRKIALTQGGPYYRIATRVSNTEVTLSDAYAETTASASTYVLFQDEYDLAVTTHSIEDASLVTDAWTPPLRGYAQRQMDMADYTGRTTGKPLAYGPCASTTVGTPRVRFLPVPDDIYRISFRYLKTWTDLSADGDLYTTQGLPVDIEELALDRALRWAPKIEGSRRVMSDTAWTDALREVWRNYRRMRYPAGQRRGIGSGMPSHGIIVSTSGLT